jgi:hypothetical protein
VEVDEQPAAAKAADDAPTMTNMPRIESFPILVISRPLSPFAAEAVDKAIEVSPPPTERNLFAPTLGK